MPEQIEGRLVFHDVGRRDQHAEDDPRLPTINDVVVMLAHSQATTLARQQGRIRVSRTGCIIRAAPIGTTDDPAIWSPEFRNPVMSTGVGLSQFHLGRIAERDRLLLAAFGLLHVLTKERVEMGLDGEAGRERVERGVGINLRGIEIKFDSPDEARRPTLLDDGVKERPEDVDARAVTDARQAGVIWQGFVAVRAELPADTESIRRHREQLAFRAEPREEEHQLELEEHHGIDGWPSGGRRAVGDDLTHERPIEAALDVAVAVIRRNKIVQGQLVDGTEGAGFGAHHDAPSLLSGRTLFYRSFFNTLGHSR